MANDLREGKLTLPVIFLLRRAGRRGAQTVTTVLADRGFERVSREELLRLAREHGALDEARALAERYAEAARSDLPAFDRSPYREALAGAPRLHPRPRPLTRSGRCAPDDPPRQAETRIAELRARDPPPRAPLLRPAASPRSPTRSTTRSSASCATWRAEHPGPGHARQPHPARGRRPSEQFPTFVHRVPMLSLDNTYSEDELREFEERIFRQVGERDDRLRRPS